MKKKRVVRNRTAGILLGIAATGFLLGGCGQQSQQAGDAAWKTGENSVYVDRECRVKSALVYTSDKANELYDAEELKVFAEETVSEYNAQNGAAEASENQEGAEPLPVAIDSVSLENQTGTLVFEYGTPEHYGTFADFSGDNTNTIRDLTVIPSEDAVAEGALSEFTLKDAGEKDVDPSQILKSADYTIVTYEGAGTLCTQGKIAYVSGGEDSVTLRDDYTALSEDGRHCVIFQ